MGICGWLLRIAGRRTGGIPDEISQRELDMENRRETAAEPGILTKCYHCGGAGTVWKGTLVGPHLPSRAGYFEGFSGTTPYTTCPICHGSGILPTNASR